MDGEKHSSGKRVHPQAEAEEADGRNKRRNSEFDRGSAMPGVNDTVYRILCPGNKIGSVIGRGGNIIKLMRQETHAKIKIADSIPGVDERVIIIFSAPKEGWNKDEEKDNDVNDEDTIKAGSDREPVCPAQDALFRVHARIVEGDGVGIADYEEEDANHPVICRLLVPSNQIGCLLGRGGKIIEKMRMDTGAQIRIMSKEQLPPCAMNTDELVQISGDSAVVKKALYEISARLHENPPKHQPSFHNAPLVANHNSFQPGGPIFSSVNLLPQGNPMWSNHNVGAPIVGIAPPMQWFGGYGAEPGSAWQMNSSGVPIVAGLGGPTIRNDGAKKEEVTIRILCPNERVRLVIGKGGSTINQIRQETRANIKIGDAVPESEETEIVVSAAEFPDDQVSPTIEAILKLQGKTGESSDREGGITTRLLVPSSQIGCLIGKGGGIISEMRRTTRADIRIMSKDNIPKCASENDELVQIAGDFSCARDALFQIVSRLRAKVFQDTEGSGKGSRLFPTNMTGMSMPDGIPGSSHFAPRQEMGSPGRAYSSSRSGLQGTGGKSATGNYSNFGTMQGGGSGYEAMQGGYPSSRTTGTGASAGLLKNISGTTVEVSIPNASVGSVLGKGGSNISHIRQISGAKVKLHDSQPGSSDRVIEISGTPEQTHAAQSLLQAFIATGQQNHQTHGGSRAY